MRRGQDGMGRSWLGLLGVSSLALLSGCGWFDGGPPAGSAKLRPGADRQIQANGALPSANPGRQYEQGISAADETRGQLPQIGSIVAAKGGQKAQREAVEKEAAERDAKAREARVAREAAEKEAKAKEPKPEPSPPPTGALPGMPAAAQRGNPDGVTKVTPAPAAPAPAPQPARAPAAGTRTAIRRSVTATSAPFAATPAVATSDSMPAVTRAAMTTAPAAPPPPPRRTAAGRCCCAATAATACTGRCCRATAAGGRARHGLPIRARRSCHRQAGHRPGRLSPSSPRRRPRHRRSLRPRRSLLPRRP